jgi:hypothetical protein
MKLAGLNRLARLSHLVVGAQSRGDDGERKHRRHACGAQQWKRLG